VTTVLQIIAVAAIVFGVVIAVTGRGRGFDDVEPDLADNRLHDGPITARHIDEVKFSLAVRGYRMDEVDDALDRVSAELARRDDMIAELRAQLGGDDRSPFAQSADGDEGRSPGEIPIELAPLPEGAPVIDDFDDETDDEDAVDDEVEFDDDDGEGDAEDVDEDADEDSDEDADDGTPYAAAQATFAGNEEWIEPDEHGEHVDEVAEKVAEHQIGVAPWTLGGAAGDDEAGDDEADDTSEEDAPTYTPDPVAVPQPEDRPAWADPEAEDALADLDLAEAAAPAPAVDDTEADLSDADADADAADADDAEDAVEADDAEDAAGADDEGDDNPYRPTLPPFFRQ
jgi:DivIVA domain-containing protein